MDEKAQKGCNSSEVLGKVSTVDPAQLYLILSLCRPQKSGLNPHDSKICLVF